MNAIQFGRLMYNIFKHTPPNIEQIQKQGLLAVKIGQTFALRIDFLSAESCNELTKLYRSTTAIPSEQAEELIAKYTDTQWAEHFTNIDYEPFASASVGQAHMGILADTNETVVIKLIKQHFTEDFRKDVQSVKRLMRFAIALYPTLRRVADPIGILEHIEEYTLHELDLRNEADGQQILRTIKEDYSQYFDLSELHFPAIKHELSNEHILVSEYVKGKTFDELLTDNELSYEQLLRLFKLHGLYLFGAGVFHGDLHSGNVMLGDDNNIYMVDTGAIGHVTDRIRVGLFNFFTAMSEFDWPKTAKYLNEMAEVQISGKAYAAYEKKFIELYADFEGSTVSEVSLTQKMMHTIKLGVKSGMQFEKGMFAIIKSMMYLDGMVLRCNPDAQLLKDMRPFINEFKPLIQKEAPRNYHDLLLKMR